MANSGATLLNNKQEYNRCLLPELAVTLGKNKLNEEKEVETETVFKKGRPREEVESEEEEGKEGPVEKRRRLLQVVKSTRRKRTSTSTRSCKLSIVHNNINKSPPSPHINNNLITSFISPQVQDREASLKKGDHLVEEESHNDPLPVL